MQEIEKDIFSISNNTEFYALAMKIFRMQAAKNSVYAKYLEYLKVRVEDVEQITQIPFLPLEFFKQFKVVSSNKNPDLIFESSGTTGQQTSKHYIISEELYIESFLKSFFSFYGDPENFSILALLPSYLERENSSLVYMMSHLMSRSKQPGSGFYLNNLEDLARVLKQRNEDKIPTLLLGVSYALLDLAEMFPVSLSGNITVMETGGMKGRRKEMVREELHEILKNAFHIPLIHSEYGMTELLSQAYSKGEGKFYSPPWMKVICRDAYDPLTILPPGYSGSVNIIDLANLYSCSFIATGDLGRVYEDGSFEISGRQDHAEVRGCNLMVI